MRRSKYNAVKTDVDGFRFDSKHEAGVYIVLRDLERKGQIRALELQVPFSLDAVSVKTGKPEHIATYIADFVAQDVKTGQTLVYDAKGFRTAMYRRSKKHFEMQYGIKITEL